MKLTSLRIISKDIKAAVAFYEQIMGITATWYTEDFAELSTGSITIAIGSTRTMQMFSEGLTNFAGSKSTIIEFMVKNVDEEYERIKSIASRIIQEPTTMPWGNRSLLFCDPDENMINFFTPVSEEAVKKFS
ncbi:putative enzyme related to lactoylglutathione lyase [Chryseobacterium bernardetii]|jgi:predicted enzyme related to lactoylglutathione lyase|uniref:Enzyme related to lactoylglutathione lyase n=3 Tax=Chryseobacterium TaxID=59732 RepID=A0ACC6IUJ5_9FLAO|nr:MULTISPECIES: VOC family protein [Chryseobacterium]MDR6370947.1 putative enzyme related to lactoylglutathione lyase [Chryseobacterium vietnamense]MDR6441307.1 putative enzyme related to lactoylglutathione lyase [Chryseobacterium bernardetii]MDR6457453.1 putative enzyme related to lactoylglutathione lyase [Chryseobacterium vietnamense]MDR6486188.1 putative enzyme related to lactoylglutathione lyase [Chryseobacterium vietnamense]TQM20938.1 putative enzyme related to lactoylglutathione lyase [